MYRSRFMAVQSGRFDVFLCHHGADGEVGERIAERLGEGFSRGLGGPLG
jgi:hypothetical protein